MYLDDGILALDRDLDLGLGQRDLHVAALDVGRNGRGDVHVTDGLSPFVGQLSLLGLFTGLAFLLLELTLGQFGR